MTFELSFDFVQSFHWDFTFFDIVEFFERKFNSFGKILFVGGEIGTKYSGITIEIKIGVDGVSESFFFSNLPSSLARTRERSVATLGFSAIMRVFGIPFFNLGKYL